jgi:hypothetical protein
MRRGSECRIACVTRRVLWISKSLIKSSKMSKPTDRQKEVIALIEKLCGYWASSNDIHSPSHYTDIESELSNMGVDGTLSATEVEVLENAATYMFSHIAALDDCTFRSSHGG